MMQSVAYGGMSVQKKFDLFDQAIASPCGLCMMLEEVA